jgi:phosphoglucosamine mutase
MLEHKKSLADMADEVTMYPQVLQNVRVQDKAGAQNDPKVVSAIAEVTEALGDTGRILVRESGTEPVVRVMVEAETEEECRAYVDKVCKAMESWKA